MENKIYKGFGDLIQVPRKEMKMGNNKNINPCKCPVTYSQSPGNRKKNKQSVERMTWAVQRRTQVSMHSTLLCQTTAQ